MSSSAIAFVTIGRPMLAQRFVRSARRQFPELPIYVADQSRHIGAMREFYAAHGVQLIPIEFDRGLAAARNSLARAIKEDYFLLCDDDYVLGPASDIGNAIQVLQAFPDIAVVGGRLHDLVADGERIRNWEMFFHYDARLGVFTAIPIYNFAPVPRRLGGVQVYMCDAVMNFAVYRRAMFEAGIQWDSRIKINGEHEDFFLNLKRNSSYRVAYLPSLAALHHHLAVYPVYESALRARVQGWRIFLDKWQLSQHLELGTGGRPLASGPAAHWFASCQSKSSPAPGIRVAERMPGQPAAPNAYDSGLRYMRLRFADDRSDAAPGGSYPSLRDWLDELPAKAPAPRAPRQRRNYRFRYDPVRPKATDFVFWHWKADWDAGDEIRIRWSTERGQVLVWESEPIVLEGGTGEWWVPARVPMPVWPRGVHALRFDVLHLARGAGFPVATGFVVDGLPGQADAHDAVALEMADGVAAQPAASGSFLARGQVLIGQRFVSVDLGADASALDWRATDCGFLGRRDVRFRIPGLKGDGISRIVLPRAAFRPAAFRLWREQGGTAYAAHPLA